MDRRPLTQEQASRYIDDLQARLRTFDGSAHLYKTMFQDDVLLAHDVGGPDFSMRARALLVDAYDGIVHSNAAGYDGLAIKPLALLLQDRQDDAVLELLSFVDSIDGARSLQALKLLRMFVPNPDLPDQFDFSLATRQQVHSVVSGRLSALDTETKHNPFEAEQDWQIVALRVLNGLGTEEAEPFTRTFLRQASADVQRQSYSFSRTWAAPIARNDDLTAQERQLVTAVVERIFSKVSNAHIVAYWAKSEGHRINGHLDRSPDTPDSGGIEVLRQYPAAIARYRAGIDELYEEQPGVRALRHRLFDEMLTGAFDEALSTLQSKRKPLEPHPGFAALAEAVDLRNGEAYGEIGSNPWIDARTDALAKYDVRGHKVLELLRKSRASAKGYVALLTEHGSPRAERVLNTFAARMDIPAGDAAIAHLAAQQLQQDHSAPTLPN